jgi:hypothetical protein
LFYTQQLTINIYLEELKENLAANQTDKDGKQCYTQEIKKHSTYIEKKKKEKVTALLLRSHLIQKNRRRSAT